MDGRLPSASENSDKSSFTPHSRKANFRMVILNRAAGVPLSMVVRYHEFTVKADPSTCGLDKVESAKSSCFRRCRSVNPVSIDNTAVAAMSFELEADQDILSRMYLVTGCIELFVVLGFSEEMKPI